MLALCREYALPFHCYTAAQLQQVAGTFTPSAFVAQTVGVDNVCERAAVLDVKAVALLKTSLEEFTWLSLEEFNKRISTIKKDRECSMEKDCCVW